jgi:hypothetical protein
MKVQFALFLNGTMSGISYHFREEDQEKNFLKKQLTAW